uniref:ZP domain-containing protein n=1 Tax=Scleropages formosus TaxID=113540 RepID=A0A8C9QP87_SCLFO
MCVWIMLVHQGMFRTECRDGHFWLTVGSGFLGRMFRFDTEGRSGVHTVSDQRAAICGYTMLLDSWGNLVLRASYLACDVDTRVGSRDLMVWFVNKEANDEETSYPFLLTCPLQQWSPREIMCEENYMEVKGIDLEVISITIFYRYQWTLFKVDASVACNKGTMDGTYILWSIPQILPPLVQGPVRNQGARMGVGGRLLSACLIQQRGYKMEVRDGVVEVRIPFGAVGGQIKSHVMAGRYSQSYSVDLFYVQQWGDAQWTLTRHRSFRPLWTTPSPHSPRLVNLTVPEEGDFSVTLGVFPPDVSLANVTIATLTVPLAGAEELGLRVTQVPFPNGTHAYLLQVPFPHPLVSQKVQEHPCGKYRRYTLAVTFTLLISPHREVFTHSASVVCDLQDVVLPRVEGRCTDKTMKLTLHRGNMDTQWAIFFGNHRLEPDLVEFGGYSLEAADDYFTVEVPLYSLGMAYEDLSLQGLLANVAVSVLDVETGAVEQTFIQRCTFHVRELMVCLPNSWMVVVVDTARVVPPLDPRDIALLDPSCRPKEMDRTRALFSFSLDSCGTIQGVNLVYVNEVRYMPRYLPIPQPFFHPFYYYRQPLGCRYPLNGTRTLAIYQSRLWPLSRTRPSQHNPFVRAERG